MRLSQIISLALTASVVLALVYGTGAYLQFNMGRPVDWIVGVASFFWLLSVVTIPWNMHFRAREVLADADLSQSTGINIRSEDRAYAQGIAKRYLLVALLLHLVSTLAFYALAYWEVSGLGYWASGAALLLTLLRPLMRLHDFVVHRLENIRGQVHYPREDINVLRSKLDEVYALVQRFDSNQQDSEYAQLLRRIGKIEKQLEKVFATIAEERNQNAKTHEQLKRSAEEAIGKLSEDARFLNQVRELVQFIKRG